MYKPLNNKYLCAWKCIYKFNIQNVISINNKKKNSPLALKTRCLATVYVLVRKRREQPAGRCWSYSVEGVAIFVLTNIDSTADRQWHARRRSVCRIIFILIVIHLTTTLSLLSRCASVCNKNNIYYNSDVW